VNPYWSIKQLKPILSVLATSLLALATVSVLIACSPKPSAEETAAQTKLLVDRAVEDTKKQMLAEKDKQDVIAAAQVEEKAKQDAAVAQAVANAKKEFAAEQHAANAKKERRTEQRTEQVASTTVVKPNDYSLSPVPEKASVCANCAVVLSVKEIEAEGSGSGLGVVAGGVVGGVLGNQVGNGSGRDLATIAGAFGGAFAGNKIEKVAKKTKSYNIVVKMDSGENRTFNQLATPHVVSGDKVKIENNAVVKR